MLQFCLLLLPAHRLAASRGVWSACLALWAANVCGPAHRSAGATLAGGLWLSTRVLQR